MTETTKDYYLRTKESSGLTDKQWFNAYIHDSDLFETDEREWLNELADAVDVADNDPWIEQLVIAILELLDDAEDGISNEMLANEIDEKIGSLLF